jgi:HK97 family phage major capsid protein
VETKLETDVLTDVLAWSGIQARIHANASYRGGATTDTLAETLRRAITDIYLEFYRPDGIVLHPTQGENLELLRETSPGVGAFLNIYDSATMRVWRVPVVETPAMTSGTALVGQFKLGVTVWDRMQTEILTGQPNDLFLRNAWAILAELRAAWAVTRPKALEKITGM